MIRSTYTEPAKGILTRDGCEVYDNDGSVKYILRSINVFNGKEEQKSYYLSTFVKDGNGWVQSDNNAQSFLTISEFVNTIKPLPEFSQAVKQLLQEMKEKVS